MTILEDLYTAKGLLYGVLHYFEDDELTNQSADILTAIMLLDEVSVNLPSRYYSEEEDEDETTK